MEPGGHLEARGILREASAERRLANWVLGNHDKPRLASRIGRAQARIAAMLLLTLRGTPTIYQGEEIGMADVSIPRDRVVDSWEINVPGLGLGRDPERTPMQWDASAHAGFSSVEPWLPVGSDYRRINVTSEKADATSMLSLYRALIALRRAEPALAIGSYVPLAAGERVLSYERRHAGRALRIALNMSAEAACTDLHGPVLLSSYLDRKGARADGGHELRPAEGIVVGTD